MDGFCLSLCHLLSLFLSLSERSLSRVGRRCDVSIIASFAFPSFFSSFPSFIPPFLPSFLPYRFSSSPLPCLVVCLLVSSFADAEGGRFSALAVDLMPPLSFLSPLIVSSFIVASVLVVLRRWRPLCRVGRRCDAWPWSAHH